ncbi:RES family NAD+ phosphorylase [Paucihalobacter sp.]|uniref:RES family NAD+ phosphorylase n=1 Tax=Paucihalobacter sp. TaxID=2850405 RepID=UPI002FDFE4AC
MIVYRLSRKKYANELSGKGAALFGNRWNSKGVEMIYTSESRALAMAEVAVHLTLATLPNDFVLLEILIPDKLSILEFSPKELSKNWNAFPHHPETQLAGDQFIRDNHFAVMKVPSAVVQGDFNYIINPYHSQFKLIKIAAQLPFLFDQRLFKSS